MPEISHRCPACGASTRDFGEGVLFCPECGKPLAGLGKSHEDESQSPAADDSVVAASASRSSTGHSDQPPTDASAIVEKAPSHDREERATARERARDALQRAS